MQRIINRTITCVAALIVVVGAFILYSEYCPSKGCQNLRHSFSRIKPHTCSLTCNVKSAEFSITGKAFANDIQSEVERALMCQCGCGIVLKDCPHERCGFAIPAKEEIAYHVSQGMKKDQIIDIFVKKHGQKALAMPKKEGFNLVGYILPFVVLIAAAFLFMKVMKAWASKGRNEAQEAKAHVHEPAGSELDRKIEEELKKLD